MGSPPLCSLVGLPLAFFRMKLKGLVKDSLSALITILTKSLDQTLTKITEMFDFSFQF